MNRTLPILGIILLLTAPLLYGEALFLHQSANPFIAPESISQGNPTQTANAPAIQERKKQLIQIEAQVLEIARTHLSDLGLEYSRDKDSLLEQIHTLVSAGSAQLLAKPRISALEDEEAVIQIGDRIPYAVPAGNAADKWTVQYLDTGVKLKIKSNVEDGFIIVQIHPEVSHISQWKTNQAGSFPIISTRKSNTKVRVRNNEPIIIGGLINDHQRETTKALPLLGDMPLIGFLFQYTIKETLKTDIVFIIVPKIVS